MGLVDSTEKSSRSQDTRADVMRRSAVLYWFSGHLSLTTAAKVKRVRFCQCSSRSQDCLDQFWSKKEEHTFLFSLAPPSLNFQLFFQVHDGNRCFLCSFYPFKLVAHLVLAKKATLEEQCCGVCVGRWIRFLIFSGKNEPVSTCAVTKRHSLSFIFGCVCSFVYGWAAYLDTCLLSILLHLFPPQCLQWTDEATFFHERKWACSWNRGLFLVEDHTDIFHATCSEVVNFWRREKCSLVPDLEF